MNTLIFGVVVFFGIHVLPMTAVKKLITGITGPKVYKIAFSVISVIGLILMGRGLVLARSGPESALPWLYTPADWSFTVSAGCMLIAMILLAISFLKGRLKKLVKNPMSLAVGFWATGHLFSNGSQAEVLFFGAFLLYAVLDITYCTLKGKVAQFEPKPLHDFIAPVAGILLYAAFLVLHPYLFGVSVVL